MVRVADQYAFTVALTAVCIFGTFVFSLLQAVASS